MTLRTAEIPNAPGRYRVRLESLATSESVEAVALWTGERWELEGDGDVPFPLSREGGQWLFQTGDGDIPFPLRREGDRCYLLTGDGEVPMPLRLAEFAAEEQTLLV